MSIGGNDHFGEVYAGISFEQDEDETWATNCSSSQGACLAGGKGAVTLGTVTGKTVKLYAVKDGRPAGDALTVSGGMIDLPVDNDRDANGKAIIYATAV
jgi:hypothetical protein